MALDLAVWQRDDIGVLEAAILVLLDQPGADGKSATLRETGQGLDGRAVRNGLSERLDRHPIEIAHMSVAGHAHFGENDDPCAAARGVLRKPLDHGEVIGLIVCSMLKLRHCTTDRAHQRQSSSAARHEARGHF